MTQRPPLSPFPWQPPIRWLERGLLVGLVLGLLALKWSYFVAGPTYGPDAAYYHDIAVHVRDGHGLVTDVSLFNAGYETFPHPTAIYPVWPWLLGMVARVVPLDLAVVWLPCVFYILAILLAYRLAHRLVPGPLFPETWPVLHAGHIAAAMVGLTNAMFFHTSKPFTEGLAYFLLLLGLTRAEPLLRSPNVWRGLEVGVLMALVTLTRSQLVLGALAVGGALAWAVVRFGWRRWLAPAIAFAIGVTVLLGLQLAHIASFSDAARPVYLLRFDMARTPSELAPLQVMVSPGGLWAWIVDRSRGVLVAFGSGKMSYFHCFGLWSASLLLALPFLALDAWQAVKRRQLGLWRWLGDPDNLFKLAFALLAIGGVASLHTIHKALFTPWNFGTRHALTAGFAMFAATLYLARRPALGRVMALFIVSASIYFGFWRIDNSIRTRDKADIVDWTLAHNQPLVDWLHGQAAAEPGLVVAGPDIEVQKLASFTEGVGYHWLYRTTSWAEIDFLFAERGVRYLLVRDDQVKRLRFIRNRQRFVETFVPVATDLACFSVYRLRQPDEPLGTWPKPKCNSNKDKDTGDDAHKPRDVD